MPTLDLALLHHPVRNRHGDVIASQIDEFDVFDGCRLALAYGVRRFWLVNPLDSQRALAERLIRHGTDPGRAEAGRAVFDQLRHAANLDEVLAATAPRPLVVATSAMPRSPAIGYAALAERLAEGSPCLLLLGKAWGLAEPAFEAADVCLAPIVGATAYNHLSVRSAMAIILDRLLAPGRA